MGAAGRDFHNFNTHFRGNTQYRVIAFTAAQIPNIEDRIYPASLAGSLYPRGIPIFPESDLVELINTHGVEEVVHAYSDVAHLDVMHTASKILAAGADFRILGPRSTSLKSRRPVIAVCAVRTGSGKSPTSQFIVDFLTRKGLRVAVVRHPMPYGNLEEMNVQCFRSYEDFSKYKATVEEREEYEPYVRKGVVVWAGVDYKKILRRAERDADVILWDGGNNDFSFYVADIHITVVDPHREGHETTYHPGETNLRAADVVLIAKSQTARPEAIAAVRESIRSANPTARVFQTALKISAEGASAIRDKRVIVVEDGPTLTHGEMAYGAGTIFANRGGARIVDPSRYAVGSMRTLYRDHPHLGKVLPAMGYSPRQIREFRATINRTPADLVVDATPVDLGRLIQINKPWIRVHYALVAPAGLRTFLSEFAQQVSDQA